MNGERGVLRVAKESCIVVAHGKPVVISLSASIYLAGVYSHINTLMPNILADVCLSVCGLSVM